MKQANDDDFRSPCAVFVISAYEKLFRVSDSARLTCSGNQPGSYSYRSGVADKEIRSAYEKAYAVLEWCDEYTQTPEEFLTSYTKTEKFMRGNLIRNALREGDEVVCVPVCPFQPDGSIRLRPETVSWVDPERYLCEVESNRGRRIVPNHQVLAKHSDQHGATAFDFNHMALLYLSDESQSLPLFHEAQKLYDDISHSVSVIENAFAEAGLLPKYLHEDETPENFDEDEGEESSGMTMQ